MNSAILTLNSCQVRAKIADEFPGLLTKQGGMPPMILGAITQANWPPGCASPQRLKDTHVYCGPRAHHRISPLPEPTVVEISPVTRRHWQAINLNPNLARLRFLEIRSKITIKSGRKPFRLNSTAVPLPTPSSWGEGNISGALDGGNIKKRPSEFSCADSRLETLYGSLP